jgi:transcriptional/translational regulatory protein YebC/TACO1
MSTVSFAHLKILKSKTRHSAKSITIESAEILLIADNTVKVEGKDAENFLKLMEILEDYEDVQKVHANFDIDDKELARIGAGVVH